MSEKELTAGLPTLTNTNYIIWTRKLNGYFRIHDLYDLVHGHEKRPDSDDTKQVSWDQKNQKATGIIQSTVDDDNWTHIEEHEGNATTMWKKLDSVHNSKTPGTRFNAMNTLFNIRKEDDEDLRTLITRVKAAMQRVKNLRPSPTTAPTVSVTTPSDTTTTITYTLNTLDEELVIMTLLRALPDTYNHLRSELFIQPNLKLAMVEQAFHAEDVQRQYQSQETITAHRAFTSHRPSSQPRNPPPVSHPPNAAIGPCTFCEGRNHTEETCRNKARSTQFWRNRRNRSNNSANAAVANPVDSSSSAGTETFAANASTSPVPAEAASNLNCDTGATRIMMGDQQFFQQLRPLVREIRLANGACIYSKGEGEVIFQPWIDGRFSTIPIIFPNVLFAPDLKSNLVSVLSMVRRQGYEIRINSERMEFYREGTLQMTARIDENCVAYLNGRVLTTESANAATTLPLDRSLWHRRLGHFHYAGLEKLIREKLVEDLTLDSENQPDPLCIPCISGKQTRAVHAKPANHVSEVLGRVYVDLHGPIPTEAVPDRTKYWMPIVDEASGYVNIALLRSKDAAFDAFKRYKALVENQTGRKIKRLRDDKGGEFISNAFNKLCEESGIAREHTIRDTPEQNGVAERVNRRISEGATALLAEAKLPPSFWGFAAMAYVHVLNRSCSRTHGGFTPYENFFGKKPSVKRLRVFGCAAYVHLQKDQHRPLASHTRKCVFVGYPADRPGWMFWDSSERKIIYSDSAMFDERDFPGTSQPKEPIPDLLTGMSTIPEAMPKENVDRREKQDEAEIDPVVIVGGEPVYPPVPDPALDAGPQHPDVAQAPQRLTRELRQLKTHFEQFPDNLPPRRTTRGRQQGAMTELDSEESDASDTDNADLGFAFLTKVLPGINETKSQHSKINQEYICIPIVDAVEYALSTSTKSEPTTLADALNRPDANKYLAAAIEEVKAHLENGTWEVVRLPQGKRAIGSRWVFKIKRNADGSIERYKGRIVAKGYSQREGIDYTETFAPTARFGALRAVIALAAIEDMELESIDIATAFLNGEIDAEVYMTPPDGVEIPGRNGSEWVLKLLKALYGIKQGPRCWSRKLHTVMTDIGFKRLESDHSVFIYERDGVKVIVPVHVDDLVLASKSKEAIEKVKNELKARFKLRDQGATSFVLGVQLERDRKQRTIALSQPAYIQTLLETYRMQDCNGADTPMAEKARLSTKMSPTTQEEKEEMKNVPYREAVGKLLYLSIATRPDIAYVVSVLCRFNDNPGREHWQAVKRVLRYLKQTQHYKLVYSPTTLDQPFITHSDADLGGNVDNSRSTAGFVISIGGGAVLWSSRLQRQVALSSTEAEYTTTSATGCEMMWMREFLDELGYNISAPSTVFVDNKSAIQVAKNPEHQSTMKHVNRHYHWIWERVEEGDIKVTHVPGKDNVADIFTKPLGPVKFKRFCTLLGLRG